MAQESTLLCVDSSEWMRNGDFLPTRLDAQSDAISMICMAKLGQNPENTVGLMSLVDSHVLATPTTDMKAIHRSLKTLQPKGSVKFISGIKTAQLVLKHRQNKNQKMRVLIFIGSPVEEDQKQLVRLAKKLKKEKVNVGVVIFGDQDHNKELFLPFIDTINGSSGTSSHLVVVKPGQAFLSDAIASSPILTGENGISLAPAAGSEFGFDPSEDPELAMALRVSLEEQQQDFDEEARIQQQQSVGPSETPVDVMETSQGVSALAASLQMDLRTGGVDSTVSGGAFQPSDDNMSEEEQIALAILMSLQAPDDHEMEVDQQLRVPGDGSEEHGGDTMDAEMMELLENADFLESAFAQLPGVNPTEAVRDMSKDKGQEEKKQEGKKEEGQEEKKE